MSEQDGGQTGDPTGVASENGTARKSGRSAPRAATPDTIGAELKQAREAAGLSLQDVADRTKVRPGILTLIEADDHAGLPALTYSIGFVKAYARTVGLDPLAAGERYRAESQKGDPVPTMVDMQPLDARRMPSSGLVAGVSAVLVLALGLFWAWGAGWFASPPPPAPMVAEAPTTPEAAPDADFDDAGTESAAAADPAAPVTLKANTEVWLRVTDKDSGETFFMGTMAPAQVLQLPPGKPWVLRTGRAGALDVKVGDRAIPALGGPAETVRALSLAPTDLLAMPAAAPAGLPPVRSIDRPTDSLGAPSPSSPAVPPAA